MEEEEFRISLAVPGFNPEELSIEAREHALWIKGERAADPDHSRYLYRGISPQSFQRTFQLPEHVKVTGAKLENGLLHVDLVRELPQELRPRRIEIQVAEDASPPRLERASEAA